MYEEIEPGMEALFERNPAVMLIEECLDGHKAPNLEIGKCGLTDKDFTEGSKINWLLRQCTQLEKFILSNQ